MDYLREAVPEDRQVLLKDLFEEITLYENRADRASWRKRDDGRYEVRLDVASAKFHASGRAPKRPRRWTTGWTSASSARRERERRPRGRCS